MTGTVLSVDGGDGSEEKRETGSVVESEKKADDEIDDGAASKTGSDGASGWQDSCLEGHFDDSFAKHVGECLSVGLGALPSP